MRANTLIGRAGAAAAAALLLAALAVAPAAARSELFTIAIDLDGGVGERFESDNPLLCPSGDAFTDFERGVGGRGAVSFHLTKLIVCDDGSGEFRIRVDAGSNFVAAGGGTTGGWSVVPGSGTGDYVDLSGGGSIVGVDVDDDPVDLVDHYFGRLVL